MLVDSEDPLLNLKDGANMLMKYKLLGMVREGGQVYTARFSVFVPMGCCVLLVRFDRLEESRRVYVVSMS